jgi:excisionase family DNA binding protein
VSKAEAAAALGLERSTFTMMLKRGAIGGAAIVGEGYHARINLEAARAQIRKSASS